jgi:hypothetical protein
VDPDEYLGIPVPQYLRQFSGGVGAKLAKIHDQGSQYFLAGPLARLWQPFADRIREVVRIGGELVRIGWEVVRIGRKVVRIQDPQVWRIGQ